MKPGKEGKEIMAETISHCMGVTSAIAVIGGKWKPTIIYTLAKHGTVRFNQLMRLIPEITQKILTSSLRELENEGILQRIVYTQIPPRVEYSLTEYGRTTLQIVESLHKWGEHHVELQKAQVE